MRYADEIETTVACKTCGRFLMMRLGPCMPITYEEDGPCFDLTLECECEADVLNAFVPLNDFLPIDP